MVYGVTYGIYNAHGVSLGRGTTVGKGSMHACMQFANAIQQRESLPAMGCIV